MYCAVCTQNTLLCEKAWKFNVNVMIIYGYFPKNLYLIHITLGHIKKN